MLKIAMSIWRKVAPDMAIIKLSFGGTTLNIILNGLSLVVIEFLQVPRRGLPGIMGVVPMTVGFAQNISKMPLRR